MRVNARRITRRAWSALPRPVRREAINLGRAGRPAADRNVSALIVDRALDQDAIVHRGFLLGTSAWLGVWLIREYDPGHAALLTLIALLVQGGLLIGASISSRRYDRTVEAGRVNLDALVGAGAYPALAALQVQATPRSRPHVVWAAALSVFLGAELIRTMLTEPVPATFITLGVLSALALAIAGYALLRRWRTGVMVWRPRGGGALLCVGPDGLRLPRHRLAVPWSSVASIGAGYDRDRGMPLAITIRLADPTRTVALPTHWLDHHPGIILATAHELRSAASTGTDRIRPRPRPGAHGPVTP